MKKCKTCGNECYDKAVICPKCGCSVKTSGFKKFVKYVFFGFLGLIVLSIIGVNIRTENLRKSNPFIDQFNQLDGSHYELSKLIKSNLKDPDSFQHIETRSIKTEDGNVRVVTEYRSKNSFGGYTIGYVRGDFDNEGKLIPNSLKHEN